MTYWEERAIESAKRMDGAISEYTSEMVQSFENAKKQLQSEINSFYGKYADENKITFAQAQKELSLTELRSFKGDLKEYEKLAKNSIGTYDLTVSNLSKKARITRLQALHIQCDTILQKLYQQQKVTIEEISKRLYIEQYYQKQFDIERYTGFQFNFAVPSLDIIKKVLAMPVNGVDISTSLWRQDVDTGFKIRQTLNEMFITGKPPQAFSQNLQKIIGRRDESGNLTGKKYEAYRLLYNESSFVTEQSALQAYKDDEVDEYEIIATLDFKTTPICQHEDGKHYPVKLAVTGVNYPPFHVNCRTTTGPYIGDLKEFSSTRMARSENGESVRIKDVSYEEWNAKAQDFTNKTGIPRQEAREKVFTSGGKSDIIETQGAISGALNPYSKEAYRHAKQYYDSVRKMTTDVERISRNTGYKIKNIQKIKEHIFLKEHLLMDGKKKFDPSYEMSQSWQSLIDGKNIKEQDYILLKHEFVELSLMEKGYSQNIAHIKASKKYNYAKYFK